MKKQKLFEFLKSQSTWRLFGLAIITYGIYYAYYIKSQTETINSVVANENQIPTGLINVIMYLSYLSLAIFIFTLLPDGKTFEQLGNIIGLVWNTLLIVWGFKARNRVNAYYELTKEDPRWFHGFWTFVFTPLYFNYKINTILEVYRCPKCDKPVGNHILACPHCGNILSIKTQIEKADGDNYSLTVVLKKVSDFGQVKQLLIDQYSPLSYTKKVIDKADSLMLTSDDISESYILAKIEGHELKLETFRAERPKINIDADGNIHN